MKSRIVIVLVFTLLLTVLAGCGPGNQQPKVVAVTQDGTTFSSKKVTLEVKGEDKDLPAGERLTYTWDFGDGKPKKTTTDPKIEYQYDKPGTYNVKVIATDDKKAESKELVIKGIRVQNAVPTADAKATKGLTVYSYSFDASASRDPDGQITRYEWDFGDGQKGSGQKVNHDYVESKTYIVKLIVTDNDGATAEATLELSVGVPPSFSLSTSRISLSVKQSATSTVTVNLTRISGFTDSVTLTMEGVPARVKATFNPNPVLVTDDTSTLTLEVASDAMPGTYTVTVRGKGGGLDRTARLTLTVEPAPSFSMNLTSAAVTVKQGATIPITVNVTRVGGFTEPIQLTMEGAPAGVTAVFDPNPAPANTSTLTLAVDTALTPGSYTVRVRATGRDISKIADLTLVVFTRESVAITFPLQAVAILPEWERVEQMRDWVVYGFLAAREVPTDRIAVHLYNQPPLRNPALSEVHTWQYGIGRWVWIDDDPKDDSIGDLYAFLPAGADQRLLGGLADEFRRTTGQIPTFVHYIEYTLDERNGAASFVLSNTLEGKQLFTVGGPFGYYERGIQTRADLVEFLQRIDDLVYVKLEGSMLRLGGRDLPGWDPMVDVEDVAAPYQAYLKANDVGFSLDPQPADVGEDILLLTIMLNLPEKYAPFVALLQELPEEVPMRSVTSSEWEEARISLLRAQFLPLHRVMKKLLDEGTADARKVYNEIASLLGRYAGQCARYDGDIKGTKVGMTLFYSDLLMKLWFWDFGNSTPRDIGMVPVLEFPISPAHWRGIWEFSEGRRWLGANPSRIGKSPTSLLFSPMITRIFAAAEDPYNPGKEVEPSKLPERMRITNQWWEAHWSEIMGYEPEYFRLNQLMKFSAVMAWLLDARQMQALAFLEREPVVRTHDFEQWLKANRDHLTFKAWLPFVGKSDKGTECLSMISSEARPAFGDQAAFLQGGVTLTRPEDLAQSTDTVALTKRVAEITRTGVGEVMSGTGATYTWSAPFAVTVTPGADASFRTLALILPRIQKIRDSWQHMPNTYEYSSSWTPAIGQPLDTRVSLTRTAEGLIRVEAIGSTLVVEHLSQALSGRLEMPWEYVQEMYHKPETGELFIKTTREWFQAAAPEPLPEEILLGGSPVTSYIRTVQSLATPPLVKEENTVNLADLRKRIDSWKKGEAGCLVTTLGNFYYVATTRGAAFAYTFSADSDLAKALTGEIPWPTSQGEVNWWWGFEQFVDHLFSKLPEPIKWEYKGTKIILYTPRGVRPAIDAPKEIKNNMDRWLEVKPVETVLEIELWEEGYA